MEQTDDIVERLVAWSHDERLGDGMLLRNAADEIERLRARLAEVELDAARWRYVNAHAEWRRQKGDDRDEGFSLLVVRLPYDADLSCRATRAAAIDAAMERTP